MGQNEPARRSIALAAAAVAAVVIGVPGVARAGTLSKVVHGLAQRSGQPGPSGGSNASDADSHHGHSDKGSDSDSDGGDSGGGSFWNRPGTEPVGMVPAPYAAAPGEGPTDVSVYLGLQSVEGSDGAGAFSLRTSYGDFGIGLADTMYFESTRTRMGPSELTMHAWAMTGAWRAHRADTVDDTAVWLQAGLAGTSSKGLQVFGAVLGAQVTHNLIGAIGVEGSARVFAYQDDIRALEVRGGIAVSVLRLSYRVMKYNVAPALKGPELGVAMTF